MTDSNLPIVEEYGSPVIEATDTNAAEVTCVCGCVKCPKQL
jgi:hypothetical protein